MDRRILLYCEQEVAPLFMLDEALKREFLDIGKQLGASCRREIHQTCGSGAECEGAGTDRALAPVI